MCAVTYYSIAIWNVHVNTHTYMPCACVCVCNNNDNMMIITISNRLAKSIEKRGNLIIL